MARLSLAIFFAACPVTLLAQSNGAGVVSGTVYNASTQKVLVRAVVSVEGTNLTTYTSSEGKFRISGVPVGAQKINVRYSGLEAASQEVAVAPGGTASVEVGLRSGHRLSDDEVYELEAFTVAAEPEGIAYAMQQERTADSLRNVLSADTFGTIADANPGDFLKLVPGIQTVNTGIEPRGIVIRGISDDKNLVMIDGNQGANAAGSGTTRRFEIDQITIDNIETIEIYKAPLPSMPANAIGGTVNMVTRSAFQQKGRRLKATVNYTMNSTALSLNKSGGPFDRPSVKMHPGYALSYSDSFFDGRLGVSFSTSAVEMDGFGPNASTSHQYYEKPPSGTFWTHENTKFYTRSYGRNEHSNHVVRAGSSLNFDFKVSETTSAYLRTTFTNHEYYFANRQFNLDTKQNVVPGSDALHVETNGNVGAAKISVTTGDKTNQALGYNFGMKHRFNEWKIDWNVFTNRATNRYDYLRDAAGIDGAPLNHSGAPNMANVTLELTDIGFILDGFDDMAVMRVTQTGGPDLYDMANYSWNGKAGDSMRKSIDKIVGAKFSARRDFQAGERPFWIEFGASTQTQDRDIWKPNRAFTYVGADGIAASGDEAIDVMSLVEVGHTPDIGFGQRAQNAWPSTFVLGQWYTDNPNAFQLDEAGLLRNQLRNRRSLTETVDAVYLMGNMTLGKLDVLVGTRFEKTDVEALGTKSQPDKVTAPSGTIEAVEQQYGEPARATTSQSPDPFKYVHLKYKFAENLQARASYTEAIGRANFGDILPKTSINEISRKISVANTTLLPQMSDSMDASIEWYPNDTSALSFSVFSKSIDNYINSVTSEIIEANPDLEIGAEYVDGGDPWILSTKENLGHVDIQGLELSAQFEVKQFPDSMGRLSVFVNYSHLFKTEGTFDAGDVSTIYDELNGVATDMGNWGFSWNSPNRKLHVNLRTNVVGSKPSDYKHDPYGKSLARITYDAEIRYNITPRYVASLSARNITEAWEGNSKMDIHTRTGNGGGSAITMSFSGQF